MKINILEYLLDSADRYPQNIAAIDENNSITYEELKAAVFHIGNAINDLVHSEMQESVIIFIDKSIECLKGMLGVMYSGHYYVIMDTKTPEDRFHEIVATLENKILITTSELCDCVKKLKYGGGVYYIEELEALNCEAIHKMNWKNRIDMDLAYVLFTSGSTGVPKGVAITHRSVIDYVEAYVEAVEISEQDILGNQSPFYFDVSLKDIYMAQKVGAALCIIPSKYFMTPKKLLNFLEEQGVTAIAWVPTAYRIIAKFNGLQKVHPSKLKKFIFSGEAMPAYVYNYWKREYPDAVFIQQYGPTEITGACVSYRVNREFNDEETIPIGRAFRNTGLFLINEDGGYIHPKQTGVVGEIHVRGTCLSVGYFNNSEKTSEVFVQNPLNNKYPEKVYKTGDLAYWNEQQELIFVSRKDYQIKHSGHRIELGEVENAILAIDGINGCCCVHNRKEDEIVCFFVSSEISKKEIMIAAHKKLPKYMMPTIYYDMEELPVLPNGKLDRKQLDDRVNK